MIAFIQFNSASLVLGASLIGSMQPDDVVTVHPIITDRSGRERIELSYRNDTKHFLCIVSGDWPTHGKLNFAAGSVALVVNGRRFPIEDFNTGYCIGQCSLRFAPGAEISGFLLYKDFHLPAELRYEPKRLDYDVSAYQCDVITDWRPRLKPT